MLDTVIIILIHAISPAKPGLACRVEENSSKILQLDKGLEKPPPPHLFLQDVLQKQGLSVTKKTTSSELVQICREGFKNLKAVDEEEKKSVRFWWSWKTN